MNLTFLCANHRIWLTQQPQQAIHCCLNASETGWLFSQDGRWEEALAYFGSAYETAEIILTGQAITHEDAIENFISTLSNLTKTLIMLHRLTECRDVYIIGIKRIKQELDGRYLSNTEITKQVDGLSLELKDLEEGKYKVQSVSHSYLYSNKQDRWAMSLH